ncbi:MAG: BMP family ABC transporter substrate-binding protein, partial [Dethiobacteria bacterium]
MKRFAGLLLILALTLGLVACDSGSDNGAEIAQIIIAGGTIDDKSFNQGAWEGVVDFATEHDLTYKYY